MENCKFIGKISTAILLVLLMIPALSSCKTEALALTYGDIYSAVAVRLQADGSPAESRGMDVKEAKEIFEYLYEAKLKESEGKLSSPVGSITVKLKKQAEAKEHLYEYRLTAYEKYQAWELEIISDGVGKTWWLERTDGLDEIVKGVMEAGPWNPVESQTPLPAANASTNNIY